MSTQSTSAAWPGAATAAAATACSSGQSCRRTWWGNSAGASWRTRNPQDSNPKFENIDNFEYLNIDVEGSEQNVINGIDLGKYRPILITIENNNLHLKDYIKSEIYNILIKNNYTFINKTGVTNFFLKNEYAKNFLKLISI